MGSEKITKHIDGNLINVACQKITISRHLREEVLAEILNKEIINSKECDKLNPCSGCKLRDLKIAP
jgi:hypothetical protein